ncbi:MAG TPA: S41 family peptidase, partial [Vicinamibacterales bacterium]|nr:S41 family peptidase [Vicinamibacterales bacterium]
MTRRVSFAAVAVILAAVTAVALRAQAPLAVETFDAAWTIVRDKHFDESLNGLDWNAVRDELRPRAAAAKSVTELREVIRDMLGRLGLSHFAIVPASDDGSSASPANQTGDPGFDVRWIEREIIVSEVDPAGPAAAAGVRTGWKIMAIDSRPIAQLLRALPEGANERLMHLEAWRRVQNRLRGAPNTPLSLVFEDGAGHLLPRSLVRRPEAGQPVTVGSLPTMHVRVRSERLRTRAARNVGFVKFNVWMASVTQAFQRAVDEYRNDDGFIIDVRGNPGGLAAMIMGVGGHFTAQPKTLGIMKTRHTKDPLRFNTNPQLVSSTGERVQTFAGPVAILVDALSGSASECFAGGMQSLGRARVFGQTSMGQALPAQFSKLPNGDVLIHAFGDFVTADGTRLEGQGVIPDVP